MAVSRSAQCLRQTERESRGHGPHYALDPHLQRPARHGRMPWRHCRDLWFGVRDMCAPAPRPSRITQNKETEAKAKRCELAVALWHLFVRVTRMLDRNATEQKEVGEARAIECTHAPLLHRARCIDGQVASADGQHIRVTRCQCSSREAMSVSSACGLYPYRSIERFPISGPTLF